MRGPRLVRVWLTFGDGPGPWTPQIQDVLEEHGVRGTFFMCGKRAELRPDLVVRVAKGGHRIGSHAWSHCRLGGLSDGELEKELRTTKDLLEDLVDTPVTRLLPPFCQYDARVEGIARQFGMTTVDCARAIDPRDWEEPGTAELVRRVRHSVLAETWAAERLVLLHDGKADDLPATTEIVEDRSHTLGALPGIIAVFREHGVSMDLL